MSSSPSPSSAHTRFKVFPAELSKFKHCRAMYLSNRPQVSVGYNPPGGGGTPIWNRRGCSSELLNLTPKGDHLGVAQAFCDP